MNTSRVVVRRAVSLGCCLVFATVGATASAREIDKHPYVEDNQLLFYWSPKLLAPDGWEQRKDLGRAMKMSVLVPKGQTFDDAETIIYARAVHAPDKAKRGTLQEFIGRDVKAMQRQQPKSKVEQVARTRTAAGKSLETYAFTFPGETYEQVGYGAEGEFWIEFVISSKSPEGLARDLPAFQKMLAQYR